MRHAFAFDMSTLIIAICGWQCNKSISEVLRGLAARARLALILTCLGYTVCTLDGCGPPSRLYTLPSITLGRVH